jgi:predicted alpha/beta-hydrolase family hydrolase
MFPGTVPTHKNLLRITAVFGNIIDCLFQGHRQIMHLISIGHGRLQTMVGDNHRNAPVGQGRTNIGDPFFAAGLPSATGHKHQHGIATRIGIQIFPITTPMVVYL